MSLTMGLGPFGEEPAGKFNFSRVGQDDVTYWEATPRRYRVELDEAQVADSRDARLLHERGEPPRLFFPRRHVELGRLTLSETRTRCLLKGEGRYWSGREAEDVAWSYEQPSGGSAAIAGYVSFDLDRVDAWYEEDEKGYAHPRDPYHRADVRRTSRHVVVRFGGLVIAETWHPAALFETSLPTRFYFSPDDVRTGLFVRSETVSQCPYKGPGQHWHLVLAGGRVEDAAWSLSAPIGDAASIPDWWSFYPDKLTVQIDDEGPLAMNLSSGDRVRT